MSLTRSFIILLAGFFFVSLSPASAQIISSEPPNQDIPGTVACFDYYHFDSVQANISTDLSETVSGATLGFTGTLANDNDYPLVDASVYVKIFRRQTDEALWHKNGHLLIDQFFAAEHVDIPAKGEKPFTFEWSVPAYAQSGDYFATTYVVTQKKFNLLGLSFTKDVNGNTTDFSVQGEQTTGVTLDPNTATVGTTPANLASFINHVGKDESAPVTIKIRNTTTETKIVPVTYTLRQWDGVNEDAPLDTKTESVTLTPKETKILSYTVTDTKYPVYYLTVEAEYKDAKSIENIRFVRDGVDRARINFPAVTAYPLEADKQATVFSCLHNSGTASRIDNGKLVIEVKDARGKTVDSHTYEGPVTGAMMAVKHDFTPKETLGSFTVNTSLYQDGNLVDESVTKYDCNTLGGPCPKPNTVVTAIKNATPKQLIWTIALSLILLALLWKVVRKKETRPNGSGRGRAAVWFLALALGTLTLGQGQVAEGKSVISFSREMIFVMRTEQYADCNYWGRTQASIEYQLNAFENSRLVSEVPPGNTVSVGSTLTFRAEPKDISWSGSGGGLDTPYGYWSQGAMDLKGTVTGFSFRDVLPTHTLNYCFAAKKGQPIVSKYVNVDVNPHLGFFVHPPSDISIDHPAVGVAGTPARLSCSAPRVIATRTSYGQSYPVVEEECVVESPGNFRTQAQFSGTNGRIYLDLEYTYYKDIQKKEVIGTWTDETKSFDTNAFSKTDASITLRAVDKQGNRPPSPPIVDPQPRIQVMPPSSVANTSITAKDSIDPDGDQIRYGFYYGDANGNFESGCSGIIHRQSCVQQWGGNPVPSGGTQSVARSSGKVGTKTVWVLAVDTNGSVSEWGSGLYTVTPPVIAGSGHLWACPSDVSADGISCTGGAPYDIIGNALILNKDQNKNLVACYNDADLPTATCTGSNVSGQATWTSSSPGIVTLTRNISSATAKGIAEGDAVGTAAYTTPGGTVLSAPFGIRVNDSTIPPPPPPSSCVCDPTENAKRCKGSYTWTCSDGVSTTCQGEKNCGGWVEVAP